MVYNNISTTEEKPVSYFQKLMNRYSQLPVDRLTFSDFDLIKNFYLLVIIIIISIWTFYIIFLLLVKLVV